MADLLECLIQIKALREALRMAERPAEMVPGTISAWQRMAEAERSYAQALGTKSGPPPLAPAPVEAAEARQVFLAWRRANLARLDGCTASELAGPAAWAGHPAATVADLVAIMLAGDTEWLAADRQASRAGRSPGAGRA